MKKLLAASLVALASSSVAAQDYQYEIGVEYESNDAASAAGQQQEQSEQLCSPPKSVR